MLTELTLPELLGLLSVCLSIYYSFFHGWRKNSPPGPWGLPIFGHLLFFEKYPAITFKRWAKKYGNIFSIRMGSYNSVVLNGYDVIKAASDHDNGVFADRINFLSFGLQEEIDGGIPTLTSCSFNETFIQAKKGVIKALKKITGSQESVFIEIAQQAACDLRNNILAKGISNAINIFPELEIAIATILYKIVYGRGNDTENFKYQLQVYLEVNKYFTDFAKSGTIADVIPWWKYLIPSKVSKYCRALTVFRDANNAEIKRHQESFVEDIIGDITDFYINEQRNNMAYSDNAYKVMFNGLKELFAAGHETSSNTLKYLILYMVAYPEIQRKVYEEIHSVVGYGRLVDLNDRRRLPYTAAVIYEVLRITSLVPFAIPHRAARSTEFMGYHIDEGTFITFNLVSVNHEQSFWDNDPSRFRPDRFIDDGGKLIRERCSRVASFSFGKRSCIGEQVAKQQIFIVFATLMQQCEFCCPHGSSVDLEPVPGLVYHPKDTKIIVKERNDID